MQRTVNDFLQEGDSFVGKGKDSSKIFSPLESGPASLWLFHNIGYHTFGEFQTY